MRCITSPSPVLVDPRSRVPDPGHAAAQRRHSTRNPSRTLAAARTAGQSRSCHSRVRTGSCAGLVNTRPFSSCRDFRHMHHLGRRLPAPLVASPGPRLDGIRNIGGAVAFAGRDRADRKRRAAPSCDSVLRFARLCSLDLDCMLVRRDESGWVQAQRLADLSPQERLYRRQRVVAQLRALHRPVAQAVPHPEPGSARTRCPAPGERAIKHRRRPADQHERDAMPRQRATDSRDIDNHTGTIRREPADLNRPGSGADDDGSGDAVPVMWRERLAHSR